MNCFEKKFPLWAIILIAVALIAAAVTLLFIGIQSSQKPGDATTGSQQSADKETAGDKEAVSDGDADEENGLKTPYGTLKYPEEWTGFLRVEVEDGTPYTLTYFADLESGKSQELFAIAFDCSVEIAQAVVAVDGRDVPVHVSTADFRPDDSWSEKEINIVYSMQEALNQLLSSMDIRVIDASAQGDPVLPKEDGEEMVIDTPYGNLYYPARWKDYLDLKVEDADIYSVEFRCRLEGYEPLTLFTVCFGGDTGVSVGTTKGADGESVEIRLDVLELNPDDSLSSDDRRIVLAMQEDLNFLLTKLD